MIEELHAKFLPQFLALGRTRITRALEIVQRGDTGAVGGMLRDLHALAGEAGLLGLDRIVPLATEAETRARALHATPGEPVALLEVLGRLQRALDEEAP